MILREAGPADAGPIAAFHNRIWHETYGALAPPEAIAQLDEAHRLRQWARVLTLPPPQGAVLAMDGARIAGLVSFGPPDHPLQGTRGAIGHLYVDRAARGTGLGRRLLLLAHERLAAAGFPGAALAVVRGNLAARGFYAALGGTEAAGFTDPGPLWTSDNLLITWDFTPPDPLPSSR